MGNTWWNRISRIRSELGGSHDVSDSDSVRLGIRTVVGSDPFQKSGNQKSSDGNLHPDMLWNSVHRAVHEN